MGTEIVLVGAGGHARSVMGLLNLLKIQVKFAIVDGKSVCSEYYPFPIYRENDVPSTLFRSGDAMHLAVGLIKRPDIRSDLFKKYLNMGFWFPILVSPKSYTSSSSQIGAGTLIMHNSLVNFGVEIGVNCILNSGTIVEHDVVIGDSVHIAPGSIISGGVCIEDQCFIGAGTIICEGVTIGRGSVIGAGLCIKKSVDAGSLIK